MAICVHLLPFYGHMDENELLMQLLSKKTNMFWKQHKTVILQNAMIYKRVIVIDPMNEEKRIKMIKLQKMYEYVDVQIRLHSSDNDIQINPHSSDNNIQMTLFEYLIFYLTSPMPGRVLRYFPNFTEIVYELGKNLFLLV
jgi:hypothetical protein